MNPTQSASVRPDGTCVRRVRTADGRGPTRLRGILLLLARLGLRGGEVKTLTLEDLDRRAG